MPRRRKAHEVIDVNARVLANMTVDLPERITCIAERANLPTLLSWVDRYCERHAVDPQSWHDLHLIAEEACVNVMAHAYPAGTPGPLTLQLQARMRGGRSSIELTIEDAGKPFNPLALPVPDRGASVADLPIGGLGVHLIRRLSDVQHYAHDRQRGNVLTIAKFLVPAGHD